MSDALSAAERSEFPTPDVGQLLEFTARIVVRPSGCWECPREAGCSYARHRIDGKLRVRAHRLAYEWLGGSALQPGQHVLHTCDNPLCCNPWHLFAGGNAENAADKVAKGRQARGREHAERSANRLTPEQRDEVRRLFAAGHGTMSELGRMFGVTRTAIAKMVARTGPGLASTRPGKRHGQERAS